MFRSGFVSIFSFRKDNKGPNFGLLFLLIPVYMLLLFKQQGSFGLENVPKDKEKMYYIFSTGQSNSNGTLASPALSTIQLYSNVKVSTTLDSQKTAPQLVPLIETDVETPSSGLANSLSAYQKEHTSFIVGLHGVGGATYEKLKKGTDAYDYNIAQFSYAKDSVEKVLGGVIVPIGVTVVHGEADWLAGTSDSYKNYLEEWQRDYEKDTSVILRQHLRLPMFISQVSTPKKNDIGVKQLEAHNSNSDKIILVGPTYQYQFGPDGLHLANIDAKQLGELFAKVINQVVFEGKHWDPLTPISVTGIDNMIFVTYHVPFGSITIDTDIVAKRENYGFTFSQSGDDGVFIKNVTLLSSSTLVVLLNRKPTGVNQRLQYAYSCKKTFSLFHRDEWCGGRNNPDFAGGNIRDTDTSVSPSLDGTKLPLYDWGVTFNEPVRPVLVTSKMIAEVRRRFDTTKAEAVLSRAYDWGVTFDKPVKNTVHISDVFNQKMLDEINDWKFQSATSILVIINQIVDFFQEVKRVLF